MNDIILATNNQGKMKELQALLSPMRCISQQTLGIPEVAETGLSFIENAIIKARHASCFGHKPALADDSGLVVLALNGKPGIYSARFAGVGATDKDNIALLLKKLDSIPDENRQAYFYCAIAYVQSADDPTPIIATGSCLGQITREPQGDQGFGYDPVFYLPEHQCTFAQLPAEIKNTMSHRAMAFAQFQSVFQG